MFRINVPQIRADPNAYRPSPLALLMRGLTSGMGAYQQTKGRQDALALQQAQLAEKHRAALAQEQTRQQQVGALAAYQAEQAKKDAFARSPMGIRLLLASHPDTLGSASVLRMLASGGQQAPAALSSQAQPISSAITPGAYSSPLTSPLSAPISSRVSQAISPDIRAAQQIEQKYTREAQEKEEEHEMKKIQQAQKDVGWDKLLKSAQDSEDDLESISKQKFYLGQLIDLNPKTASGLKAPAVAFLGRGNTALYKQYLNNLGAMFTAQAKGVRNIYEFNTYKEQAGNLVNSPTVRLNALVNMRRMILAQEKKAGAPQEVLKEGRFKKADEVGERADRLRKALAKPLQELTPAKKVLLLSPAGKTVSVPFTYAINLMTERGYSYAGSE